MKSFYMRNFAAMSLMMLTCFLVVALAFVGIGRNYFVYEHRSSMIKSAAEVSRTAAAVVQDGPLTGWELSMSVSSISNATGNHIFVIDSDGRVVCCCDAHPYCEHMGFTFEGAELEKLKSDSGIDQLDDLGGFFNSKEYVLSKPIKANGSDGIIGYVVVSNDVDEILNAWSDFSGIASMVVLVVFLAALPISLGYSRRMARPLDEIAAASGKFARGDFSPRVKQVEEADNEMGALIESFNKMADSLEKAEKRRTEFIGNISHELRTPMTTIAGFADGILDGTIPKESEEKYLISIRDETRRLSRLVRDMLDVAQMRAKAADPSRRTAFDLTELVLQTLLSFESRATKKRLDVDPQLPENHIMVVADKDAITQVIYNLLDNAVKFADLGSCIVLRLYTDTGKAYVSVKNQGEPIPAEDIPFIFDRFHKSDRSRSMDKDGVGLGLYLVKTIINSHDEDIAVRSDNRITEFVFTLALAEQK